MFGTGIGKDVMEVVGATFALALVGLILVKSDQVAKLISSASTGLGQLITIATFR